MATSNRSEAYTLKFTDVDIKDVPLVGGKNASLGEMLRNLQAEGIQVPDGFAVTAAAYRAYLKLNGLDEQIRSLVERYRKDELPLEEAGRKLRALFMNTKFPDDMRSEIASAYEDLCQQYKMEHVDVAVRSSATAEDLPEASFAGQQETLLNVTGETELLEAVRDCFASLFTDRAIVYREHNKFDHMHVALSVGVQKMIRSDKAGSGVMFTLDPETGFPNVVVINAVHGIGELIVQGAVTPDEYQVFKPLLNKPGIEPLIFRKLGAKEAKMIYSGGHTHKVSIVKTDRRERESYVLTNAEAIQLGNWGVRIEQHYGRPMDIEWAKDGRSGELYIVQARPETVESRRDSGALRTYQLEKEGPILCQGIGVGGGIAAGRARVLLNVGDADHFEDGDVLVAPTTDPDWVPIMRRASAIVTDHGGRTSHAAIISRELGVPAVVGAHDATEKIPEGQAITVSCAGGDTGNIYEGILPFHSEELSLDKVPETKTNVMLNIASPGAAYRWWRLPAGGIGLARMEFIINNVIKIHPNALLRFNELKDADARRTITDLTRGYAVKADYFVDKLAEGVARIAASQYPRPVVLRMSDFKSNEYANLIGGPQFEPHEENPMIGFRGASRYYSESYKDGFALECKAVARVRRQIGLDNVKVMIPFCRTLEEADRVLAVMAEHDLERGKNGLEVYVMCEIPANVILAEEFAERFDGFSIGSNDLTQLILGVDRDSGELDYLFDERNDAVKRAIAQVIERAHKKGRYVGICGQAPSDHPDFAEFLVRCGIDSISLNPDRVVPVKTRVAEVEAAIAKGG